MAVNTQCLTQIHAVRATDSCMNWERRVPPFAEDALEVLRKAVEESGDEDESLSKDDARSHLVADDRFADTDAEYALDVL